MFHTLRGFYWFKGSKLTMDILILLYAKNGGGQRVFSGGKRGGKGYFQDQGGGAVDFLG